MSQPVFVFGSNLAGRHGAGAALFALQNHGAVYGQGVGRQGNSYAIPTKDAELKVLPLTTISEQVSIFLDHAYLNPGDWFLVTPIGTGYARYSLKEIAELFRRTTIPPNVAFSKEWFER